MNKIAIYGAGGFGKEVACIIRKINEASVSPVWDLIGFYDDGIEAGTKVSLYGTVLGGLKELNEYSGDERLNIVFAIGSTNVLQKLTSSIINPFIEFPNIIHPDVFFADERTVKMGRGNVVTRGCSFSCDVEVGDFNQFNSISALAHDVKVGSCNIFMPLVRVSGGTEIGNTNFFGIGTIILQNIKIGDNTRIAASSMIIRKTQDGMFYMGNPAKKVKL
jgi:sugar O-acyltransferase (sialic acid O-acetyltransferase NeuD family)